jgi:hypothetical protein
MGVRLLEELSFVGVQLPPELDVKRALDLVVEDGFLKPLGLLGAEVELMSVIPETGDVGFVPSQLPEFVLLE